VTDWLVMLRFAVPADEADSFGAQATEIARLLGGRTGCLSVEVARASDDPGRWTLTSRWASVGAYRRALSDHEVKVGASPFLARAINEPTAYEVLFAVDADGERTASGDLASDANAVDRNR
jgi:quinol monooxygenase YgiN